MDDVDRTIGDLAKRGAQLEVTCGTCRRRTVIDPAGLPIRYAQRRLVTVRFRCKICDRWTGAVAVNYPDHHPAARRALTRINTGVRDYYREGAVLTCRCGNCHRSVDVAFTIGEIERQMNTVNPPVRDAVSKLKCPRCGRPVLVGVTRQEDERDSGDRWKAGKALD